MFAEIVRGNVANHDYQLRPAGIAGKLFLPIALTKKS